MRAFGGTNRYQHNGIASNPTLSESSDEEEGGGMAPEDASAVSSDSGLGMQMPTGYLLGDRQPGGRRSPATSPKEGESQDLQRLVLLAKHPNVTDEEVMNAITKQQQKKQLRQHQQQIHQQPPERMDQAAFAAQMVSARADDMDKERGAAEQYQAPPKSFFGALVDWMFPPEEDVPPQEASIASHSMASEPTYKVSNVDENARRERIRKEQGHFTAKERLQSHCKRLVSTRTGIITLVLLVLLIIAMIAIIAAAVASDRSKDKGLDKSEGSTGTMIPRPDVTTGLPTGAPTSAPSPSPTQLPSAAPVTSFPTTSPTVPPSTGPTSSPTMGPTLRPTKAPTRAPTMAPTTPSPTASPTTSTPSLSPTLNFLETPFRPFGNQFLGTQAEQRFGHSIALSADGHVMAVGSPDATVDRKDQAGKVEVYEQNGSGAWILRGEALTGRSALDQFGGSVGLSADGSVLVVSEPTYTGRAGDRSGNVRAFVWAPFGRYEPLGQELQGEAASDHFGISVAISQNGRRVAIGAPYHASGRDVVGQVTVFELASDNQWTRLGRPLVGIDNLDWFGWSVDLSEDGSVMAAGAPRNLQYGGYVNCYELVNGDWEQLGTTIRNTVEPLRFDDQFGNAIRLSGKNRIAIGAPGKNLDALESGLVEVFELDDRRRWVQLGGDITSALPKGGDQLGFSIDLKGDVLVAGIPGRDRRGQVDFYEFDSTTKTWVRHPNSLLGEASSNFGFSVRLTDILAVGSTTGPGLDSGSVKVFTQG